MKIRVNQKGMAMHEQIAASFFRKCKEYCQETGDEEALAYVFGFICHYILTSTCHPYIAKYMEKTGADMMRSKRSWIVI